MLSFILFSRIELQKARYSSTKESLWTLDIVTLVDLGIYLQLNRMISDIWILPELGQTKNNNF